MSTSGILARSDLFSHLPPDALEALAGRVNRRTYRVGEVVCEQDTPGTSAFVIVGGRLQAAADERILGEAGRGELIGEISLLTGEPRTATVRALRETEVLEIEADTFTAVFNEFPGCYQAVSRQLVDRLHRMVTDTSATGRANVVALIDDGRAASRQARDLLLERLGDTTAVVTDHHLDVSALEAEHDLVVIAPDSDNSSLQGWGAGQADLTLYLVDVAAEVAARPEALRTHPYELVLVHPSATALPSNTTVWLDHHRPVGHHHVRAGDVGHTDRLVRRIRQCPHVLVLSGGGVRGLAHGGLHRALVEHDVPVDVVIGVSAGAVAGALIAMGHDPASAIEIGGEFFGNRGSPVDLTVPTVALASGRRINQWIKEMVGETTRQEDLWLRTVFVSANLTTVDLHRHETGLLWRAIRASTAIPGVFPPVAEPGGVLVDGGLVANLPIELARELVPGAVVIASDVGRRLELDPNHFPVEAEVSGWRAARSRFRAGGRVPGMVRIMAQLTALGGLGIPEGRGDLHLDFDLDDFGLFDFKNAGRIAEVGYEQAESVVAAWAVARRSATVSHGGPIT